MIARIRLMRKFSATSRFQADSLPEIRHGLDQMAFDLKGEKVGNRGISEGHVANAAILVLMAMPAEERRKLVVEAFRKLDALMAIDDPVAEAEAIRAIIAGEAKAVAPKKKNPGEEPGPTGHDLGEGVTFRPGKAKGQSPPNPKRRGRQA